MYILALEASTSSAKAMLYDPATGAAQTASEAYDPFVCRDGLADTEQVFRSVARVGRELAAGRDVAAVALCATWHSVAVCDGDMRPVLPTHNWNYMAPSAMCREVRADRELASELYSRTGCMPHVTYPREMLRYLGQRESLEGRLLPSQGAYNFYRLTGAFRESVCTVSGGGLINLEKLDYDDFALAYCGAERGQFGKLCTYQDALPLSPEGAALLGLDAGIPVVPAHADGALNQLGDGAAARGRMTMSVGTSAALRLTTDRPTLPEAQSLWCYRGATDYMAGAAVAGACNCVNWYKDVFLRGALSFEQLESGAALPDEPPVFLPFLFGERCPGWRDDRMGAFAAVRPEHNVSDLYSAVQRGVLFGMYQCYLPLIAGMGEPERISLSGGILHSEAWTQMAADLFGRELEISANANASLSGAVLLGMHAAGLVEDVARYEFPSAQGRRRVTPRPERTAVLRGQYETYLEWYRRSTPEAL